MPELRVVLTLVALLGAMIFAGAIGARDRRGVVVLVLLSFVWLTVDHQFEGRTLIVLTETNGVTVADLVAVAGLVIAALEGLLLLRRSKRIGRPRSGATEMTDDAGVGVGVGVGATRATARPAQPARRARPARPAQPSHR